MPVFDFSNDTTGKQEEAVCTYTTFLLTKIMQQLNVQS